MRFNYVRRTAILQCALGAEYLAFFLLEITLR